MMNLLFPPWTQLLFTHVQRKEKGSTDYIMGLHEIINEINLTLIWEDPDFLPPNCSLHPITLL